MAEEQKTIAIYGLTCPITGKVRYVGKSRDPSARFKQHLYIAKSKKYYQNTHVYRWLRELYQQRLKPKLIVIERVTESIWAERERYWIAHYGLDNLCNTSIGGVPSICHDGKSKMQRINFHLTEPQVAKLRVISKRMGLSRAEVFRRFLDEWLEGKVDSSIDEKGAMNEQSEEE